MSLIIATGFVALLMLAVMLSLRLLKNEAEIQGNDRRARQAFFAAEAGLAEGREAARLLLNNDPSFTRALAKLGDLFKSGSGAGGYVQVSDDGFDGFPSKEGNEWYVLFPWTRYELSKGAGAALDDNVSQANRELVDPDGAMYQSFPDHQGTRFCVFMRDDDDGDGDHKTDANGRVWIVSVGEVSVPQGLPVRWVVQSLVQAGDQNLTVSGYVQKGGGAEKNFLNNVDAHAPVMTGGASIF
jgi:hypothetical protein